MRLALSAGQGTVASVLLPSRKLMLPVGETSPARMAVSVNSVCSLSELVSDRVGVDFPMLTATTDKVALLLLQSAL
ncbi:hypothetical protein J2798_001790 [Herbaspirillum seropedicae]|nr:hypothetical protein [Herbaspirillum seropedicae]MDR6395331.1 hypothetical protein [Herbaspirillum seropedicae]